MKLTWLGHACFKIEENGYTVILDPYADGSVPGLTPVREKAQLVLCSHEHGDHNGRDCVEPGEEKENPFTIEKIETYHDDVKGQKRGPNTIHILDDGIQKVAHLGDLGCDLEPEQMEQLKNLDVLLIPVGGFYTIDGAQAAELVKKLAPGVVIPMHFRNDALGFGFDVIGTAEDFTSRLEGVKVITSSTLDMTEDPGAKVVVLQPENR